MKVGIPKETRPGERRVALVPESVKKLSQADFEVTVEISAGTEASFPDQAYLDAGARIEADSARIYANADIVLKVRAPTIGEEGNRNEVGWMRAGQILVSSLTPARNLRVVEALAERGVTFFSSNSIRALPERSRWTRSRRWPALPVTGGRFWRRQNCQVLPHADDRRRYRPAGKGLRDRSRRGRPAGHRHRSPARGDGLRD